MPMQRNGFVFLIILSITEILLLSTFFNHRQHTASPNVTSQTFPSTVTSQTFPSTVIGPSATPPEAKSQPISWKIYHNTQYGYEISYPQSWELTEAQPPSASPTSHWAGDYLQPGELQKVTFSTTQEKDGAEYGFYFEVNVSSTTLTNLNQIDILNTGGSSMVKNRRYFKLSGIDSVQLSVFEFDRMGAQIYAFNHGNLYQLHFDEDNPSDPWFSLHQQIYSTMENSFRFL